MDPTRGGDSRYNLNYSMSSIGLSLADQADLYGNPAAVLGTSGVGRSLMQQQQHNSGGNSIVVGGGAGLSSSGQCQNLVGSSNNNNNNSGSGNNSGQQQQHQTSRGIKRTNSDCYEDHHRQQMSSSLQGLDNCTGGVGGTGQNNGQQQQDVIDETTNYTSLQQQQQQSNKKSPPANGKKTKGRVKIKMEYIDNKLRRYTTFSKRKTGIMKKAYELSTLTGTQVMLLVASETGHVYTFATRKLQPMITSEAGKQLIQTCLNSPDPPTTGGSGDQRMSATGFEETELSYNIADEDSKDDRSPCSSGNESDDSSDIDSPGPASVNNNNNSQTIVTDSPILVTNSSSSQQHQQQKQQHSSQTNTTSSSSSGTNNANNTNSLQYDVMKLAGMNNILYPSTLANIPQEVLLSLVQAGHLQLHTEDDGSGHQFITIPLSMTTTSGNNTNSISGTSNTGVSSSSVGQQFTINNKIHVKDFGGKAIATPATTSIGSGNTSTSSLIINGRESPTLKIKKEIE